MEKKQILNILVPSVAAIAVVGLIALVIGLDAKDSKTTTDASGSAKRVARADANDAGMADSLPPVDAPDWRPAPGGMKVWEVKEGEGEPCPKGAEVTIHYTGWTLEGKEFDSSRKGGKPATFPLGNLIKGWQEGIPGMKPGGIRRLMIPSEWAYGERGSEPAIPPNATLVFEVKLLGWN